MSQKTALAEYIAGPFEHIQGWCFPHLWQMTWPLVEFQNRNNILNPVAEIGVFHGKFLIGLIKAKGSANNFAIDVFDMQQFNLDKAGPGNLDILKKNLSGCGVSDDAVHFMRADSMAITPRDVDLLREKSGGGFSLFSVDGCHLPEHTINDLKIAMELTVPQGLIFADDYNNPHWPGVQEGISKLYFTQYPRFLPLAFGHNKLILSHISYHADYLNLLKSSLTKQKITFKEVKRFGYSSLSVDPIANRPYVPED